MYETQVQCHMPKPSQGMLCGPNQIVPNSGVSLISESQSARRTVSKSAVFFVKFHLATSARSQSTGRKQLSIGELVCRVVGGADAADRQTLPSFFYILGRYCEP